jgi:hypothetical protein
MRTLAEGIFCLVKPMNFLFFFLDGRMNLSACRLRSVILAK